MRGLVWRQEAAHHIVLVPFFSSMFLILHLTPNHVLTCRQEELGIKSPILRPDLPSKPQPRPADPWCQNWAEKFSLIQPVVTKTAYPIRALVPCVLFEILHKCDWSIWLKLQAESHKKNPQNHHLFISLANVLSTLRLFGACFSPSFTVKPKIQKSIHIKKRITWSGKVYFNEKEIMIKSVLLWRDLITVSDIIVGIICAARESWCQSFRLQL